jgi:integrase/recombinase XerD
MVGASSPIYLLKKPAGSAASATLATLRDYSDRLACSQQEKGPLFRSFHRGNKLTTNRMTCSDVVYMIRQRAKGATLPYSTCCHTFRATAITVYLQNGGTLEHNQQIATHQSPCTTNFTIWTKDETFRSIRSTIKR